MNRNRASQMPIREAARGWIYALPPGKVFHISELYQFLERTMPALCEARGDAALGPQYKNDARWAVKDVATEGGIEPMGTRGEYHRSTARPLRKVHTSVTRTMADPATTLPALLKAWEDGTIRVGSSRVLLDLIVHHFKEGATAEQIQHSFPSLTLREVYGTIYYYLEHTEEVETYLENRERQAEDIERTVRSAQGAASLQRRLQDRRARLPE